MMNKTIQSILKVIYTLMVSGILLIWLMQDSINAYWVQTYHQQSPLANLSQYKYWQLGGKIHQKLLTTINKPLGQALDNKPSVTMITPKQEDSAITFDNKEKTIVSLPSATASIPLKDSKNTVTVQKNIVLSRSPLWDYKTIWTMWNKLSVLESFEKTDKYNQSTIINSTHLSVKPPIANIIKEKVVAPKADKKTVAKKTPQSVTINKKQMVFFAGDSMMQGIAPHVKSALYKKYGIKGIDLSKQSTGLTYSSFFDWPKTVKQTFEKHKNIGLMVVFLGPNDPWNMPNPKGGKYLKFQSANWEKVYRNKIRQIIKLAEKHKVQIIWLGVPDMRKKKLNKGVRYLNTLYQSEVKKAGGIYLPTQFLLTGKTKGYSKYTKTKKNKKVAVRTNDGIHFTVTGQRKIARQILSKITIKED